MKLIYCLTILCFFVVNCASMSQSEIEDFANFLQETSRLDQNLKSKDPEADFDEDDAIENAWEESGKFEGDLVLNDRQRRMIMTNVVEGLARNGLSDSTKRWPNKEVIYFIQREHFNLAQVQAIEDGLDDLARVSCVKFTPYKKGDRDAVVIQGSRRGCFSQVGYQGGYQILNLSGRHPVGRGCFRHGTVVHELLHTLGFYHMQSSPDRDDYIDVLWENIIQATRHNFRKYNSFAVSDFGVGYDYESVLHYSRKAFSANGQDTLVPKQLGASIGQRTGLSQKDIQKLNKMYCDADSDLFLDDTSKPPVIEKKNNKNKPFQGRGIGYHQGNAVVINLSDARTYSLNDLKIDKLNDFSRAKETDMPSIPVQGFGVTQEINANHTPENMLNEANDNNEELQELLNKFSNVVNSKMNPSDARKFDYEQTNSHNHRNNIENPVQIKSYINEDYNNEWPKLPVYKSEGEDMHELKNIEENRDEDDGSVSQYPYSDIQDHKNNQYSKNIVHYSDNDKYTPVKMNNINNSGGLRAVYDADVPYVSELFLNGQRSPLTPKYERPRQTHEQFQPFYLRDR